MACKVPNCLAIPGPLANVINQPVVAPWVRISLSSGDSFITVGNQSSNDNTAIISSFHWGMSNAVGAKIEVIDEAGGNFKAFFDKSENFIRKFIQLIVVFALISSRTAK